MNSKFDAVSVDSDIKILASFQAKTDESDVFYQKWLCDGVVGESFIIPRLMSPR